MELEKTSVNKPKAVELEKGKTYLWCTCDYSKNQPFCDKTHLQAEGNFKPKAFTAEKDGKVFLCRCKQTQNAPFCDGSHAKQK